MTEPRLTIISAQVPVELADAMRTKAEAGERSLSAEVRLAIKAHLADPDKAAA